MNTSLDLLSFGRMVRRHLTYLLLMTLICCPTAVLINQDNSFLKWDAAHSKKLWRGSLSLIWKSLGLCCESICSCLHS